MSTHDKHARRSVAYYREDTADQSTIAETAAGALLDRLAGKVIQEVSELPDRTSPEDQPEMMLVSADELRGIVRDTFGSHFARQSATD